jgi:hypothetical protein
MFLRIQDPKIPVFSRSVYDQDQVKLNMKEGNEENTSPLEGGTSHLSAMQIKNAPKIATFPNDVAWRSDLRFPIGQRMRVRLVLS